MSTYAILEPSSDPIEAVRSVLKNILAQGLAHAVFSASRTPYSALPFPSLFTDPEKMEMIDPFAPAAPFNAAKQAVSLLRHDTGKKTALVMRPCEIRALVELAKLKQCSIENVLIIGIDCCGRMENDDYLKHADTNNFTSSFYADSSFQDEITRACRSCTNFVPKGADIILSIMGTAHAGIIAESEKGGQVLDQLGLSKSPVPPERETAVNSLIKKRQQARETLVKETSGKISSIKNFQELIANCLNCYNCRVACPVCYCKECVFATDVFAHDPEVLFRRADKKGLVKLPTDTTMFHMTRMAHISHACVACGHCTSVCPSNIPVADFFITVADQTQALFDYEAGRDLSETIPYLVFEEKKQKDE